MPMSQYGKLDDSFLKGFLHNHLNIDPDQQSISSGKSDLDEEYYKCQPEPIPQYILEANCTQIAGEPIQNVQTKSHKGKNNGHDNINKNNSSYSKYPNRHQVHASKPKFKPKNRFKVPDPFSEPQNNRKNRPSNAFLKNVNAIECASSSGVYDNKLYSQASTSSRTFPNNSNQNVQTNPPNTNMLENSYNVAKHNYKPNLNANSFKQPFRALQGTRQQSYNNQRTYSDVVTSVTQRRQESEHVNSQNKSNPAIGVNNLQLRTSIGPYVPLTVHGIANAPPRTFFQGINSSQIRTCLEPNSYSTQQCISNPTVQISSRRPFQALTTRDISKCVGQPINIQTARVTSVPQSRQESESRTFIEPNCSSKVHDIVHTPVRTFSQGTNSSQIRTCLEPNSSSTQQCISNPSVQIPSRSNYKRPQYNSPFQALTTRDISKCVGQPVNIQTARVTSVIQSGQESEHVNCQEKSNSKIGVNSLQSRTFIEPISSSNVHDAAHASVRSFSQGINSSQINHNDRQCDNPHQEALATRHISKCVTQPINIQTARDEVPYRTMQESNSDLNTNDYDATEEQECPCCTIL